MQLSGLLALASYAVERLRARAYCVRCSLGAWLLREHVAASIEHYKYEAWRAQTPSVNEHCAYIDIGLQRAIGIGGWRRFQPRP